jgi:AraC-like DNA-binding protein
MDFTPTLIDEVPLPDGRIELIEWHWPDLIGFLRREDDLMVEMSLAPYAADASAEFPELAPGNRCFMGTLFVRYPGVAIHGRGDGGHIRVVRMIFTGAAEERILRGRPLPPVAMLQGLLDIRNDTLRKLMTLALRELTTPEQRSPEALAALHRLVGIELGRLLERQLHAVPGGRLAAWQYRRIRERLAKGGPPPKADELARLCGISVRHLNRQFHALTGTTLADYVGNYWIERAKALLLDHELPVKSVAHATGFAHPNSFARAFRRAVGVSPQQFRQRSAPAVAPVTAPVAETTVETADPGSEAPVA